MTGRRVDESREHGGLLRWLLERDLVEELNLPVHPATVGDGLRLFPERGEPLDLDLLSTQRSLIGNIGGWDPRRRSHGATWL